MQLFRSVNVDWIGRRRVFIGVSLLVFLASLAVLLTKGPRYGIDFRGGTLVYVKFLKSPDLEQIRSALRQKGFGDSTIQRFGTATENEVIISLEQASSEEQGELDRGRVVIGEALNLAFKPASAQAESVDLNNIGEASLAAELAGLSGLQSAVAGGKDAAQLAAEIIDFRDSRGGLVQDFEQLKEIAGINDGVVQALKSRFYLGEFAIRNTEIVGAKVGKDLQRQAVSATLYALGGMLVYVAWRFKGTVYGTAAVVAVFHDVIITLGFFSVFNKEISLTVIAALLTLVGYSMNDTIVVFDRIRENLKLSRREPLAVVVNRSINQTLSRTILTSGLTFIAVVSLYLFGGEVINGFAFALVIGILIGTYSSIAVASPLLVIWHDYQSRRKALAKA
ncbi:MAG: protein translocase subunit SecF [Acidobacteriota bacterium]